MKKVLLFALVMLISIAFVGAGFAQEKAKAPEKAKPAAEKPAVEKPAPAKEEKPAEAKEPEKAAEKPKPKPMAGFCREGHQDRLGVQNDLCPARQG